MTMKLMIAVILVLGLIVMWNVRADEKVGKPAMVSGLAPAEVNVKTEQAIFAAGCFWGVESTFRSIKGVVSTAVGYTGGTFENPTYKLVCTDRTGHAEAVRVTYDPTKVSYAELLDAFWTSHDPTTLNRQGPDVGTQYRSAIFTTSDEQQKVAEASLKEVTDAKFFKHKIVTQILPAAKFYTAEEYHQQYFEKQGMPAECHVGVAEVHTNLAKAAAEARKSAMSAPASQPTTQASGVTCSPDDPNATCGIEHWKQMTDAEMRAKLTPQQYEIARNAGTERAFTGKYWDEHRPGIYRCAVCGQELFNSDTKFESGTGWPSFYQAIKPAAVKEKTDRAYGMERTEVLCSRCESHLGHVFDDGPQPTGKRYCMNSAVLDLQLRTNNPLLKTK